jgi:hypothetical protein
VVVVVYKRDLLIETTSSNLERLWSFRRGFRKENCLDRIWVLGRIGSNFCRKSRQSGDSRRPQCNLTLKRNENI